MSSPRNVETNLGIVRSLAPSTVVDIGCGGGNYGAWIRQQGLAQTIVGVDAWEGNRNRLWDCYDAVVIGDVRTVDLPRADMYLLIDIIEHMSREDGKALLSRLDSPALVCTPRHWPQDADENPYQAHVSEWSEDDFAFILDMSDDEFVIGVVENPNDNRVIGERWKRE